MTPFQIAHGRYPRCVLELIYLKDMEKGSAQVEDFVEVMRNTHHEVQDRFKHTSIRYKEQVDKKKSELQFQVGDMVMIHLSH